MLVGDVTHLKRSWERFNWRPHFFYEIVSSIISPFNLSGDRVTVVLENFPVLPFPEGGGGIFLILVSISCQILSNLLSHDVFNYVVYL